MRFDVPDLLPSARSPFFVCAAPLRTRASWQWQLPADRYKKLEQFERAQYDKAASLLDRPATRRRGRRSSRSSRSSSPTRPSLSYALFMRGYCLQQAKQRNAAVKVYQEVLDYFADQADDAAAALYFMGVAHLENGDTRKGLQCMKELVENPAYQQHPLAAGALRRLADNYWSNKEPEQAVQVLAAGGPGFRASQRRGARRCAAGNLACYAIITSDYAGYESFCLEADAADRDKPRRTAGSPRHVWQRAWSLYAHRPASTAKSSRPRRNWPRSTRRSTTTSSRTKPWWKGQRPVGLSTSAL